MGIGFISSRGRVFGHSCVGEVTQKPFNLEEITMKVDEAKKIADAQIEHLVAALKEGKSGTLSAYLSAMSRFHQYSFRNLLLIFSQRPEATQVAGFNTWKKLGRWVKKGEHGIVIIAPIRSKKAAEEKEEEDHIWFKASYVFDVSQTEGETLPEFAEPSGDPGQYLELLKGLIAERAIKLEYSKDLGTAEGMSKGGVIVIKEGLPPAREFTVLVHELTHEAIHHLAGDNKSKTVRETEAEAVAFVVSEAVGLTTGTSSSDYIQLYRGDTDTLKESLEAVQKTAAAIISALHPEGE